VFGEPDGDPTKVFVSVHDNGAGFDTDTIERRGLGQSIIDPIDAVGGTVTIDARPGRGTGVTMVVPRETRQGGRS
jgi:signal transduction histidine kinase